jgi:hypothetical protein
MKATAVVEYSKQLQQIGLENSIVEHRSSTKIAEFIDFHRRPQEATRCGRFVLDPMKKL